MKLLVFTAGFYDRDYDEKLRRLKASCEKFEIELQVYGRKEFFNFFDSKITAMGRFVNRFKKDYTHVLYTDAADTFFLTSLPEILQKYEAMGSPQLLLSAEKGCYPFPHLVNYFPDNTGPYRFFNAGGFIGEIQYLLDTLSGIKSFHYINNNDNAHWMLGFAERKITFSIDHNCQIFQTMSDVAYGRDVLLQKNGKKSRVFNAETKTFPSIIHFNGPKGLGTRNDMLMEEVFQATW